MLQCSCCLKLFNRDAAQKALNCRLNQGPYFKDPEIGKYAMDEALVKIHLLTQPADP